MQEILNRYKALFQGVDEWFGRIADQCGPAVVCGAGCAQCCRGLFDITLLDAFYLKSGYDKLDTDTKKAVTARAEDRLLYIQSVWPEFLPPYTLNYRPDKEWQEVMQADDETPCVLLGADGRCLAYDHRPMTCRLHGVPLIDVSGDVMDDQWCTLNFTGEDVLANEGLRWEFRKLFQEELFLFHQFTTELLGTPRNELDMFIPTALLLDFSTFDWKKWSK